MSDKAVKSAAPVGTRAAISKGSFYFYDPNDLILVTDQSHELFDPRALEPADEMLVQSMLKHGFKTSSSIEVKTALKPFRTATGETPAGIWVVDGRRRVIAAREAKRRQEKAGADLTIGVRCLFAKDDAFNGMIINNSNRKDESITQKGMKAKRAINDMGRSIAEVAQLFGVTTQTISNWVAVSDLPEVIQRAVEDGKIPMTLALDLGKKTPEEQAKVLADAEQQPIRGAAGKRKIRKPENDSAKRLSANQLEKLRMNLLPHKDNVNAELAIALIDFISGDDPTAKKLNTFQPPLRDVAREIRKE